MYSNIIVRLIFWYLVYSLFLKLVVVLPAYLHSKNKNKKLVIPKDLLQHGKFVRKNNDFELKKSNIVHFYSYYLLSAFGSMLFAARVTLDLPGYLNISSIFFVSLLPILLFGYLLHYYMSDIIVRDNKVFLRCSRTKYHWDIIFLGGELFWGDVGTCFLLNRNSIMLTYKNKRYEFINISNRKDLISIIERSWKR